MTNGEGFAWEVSEKIGEQVLDMADRLLPVNKITPGAQAKLVLEIDDVEYELIMRIKPAS